MMCIESARTKLGTANSDLSANEERDVLVLLEIKGRWYERLEIEEFELCSQRQRRQVEATSK